MISILLTYWPIFIYYGAPTSFQCSEIQSIEVEIENEILIEISISILIWQKEAIIFELILEE